MLVRHRGGNRVMIWRGFGRFLGGRRVWQRPLQRVLGRATEFVEPVAGRAARLLEAADAWVGDGVRRASSGADGRRLLEHFPSSGLNRFATVSDSQVAALFHKRVHTRVQVDLFAGGILCIDS